MLERCLEFQPREFQLVYFKKKGLLSILVQNSQKVTKKVLVFRKVARSCSLTKKLLKILKVAEKLPSRILERPSPGQGAKNMNCYKRLTYQQFVQISGLCGHSFHG